jgi:hypothetical protein
LILHGLVAESRSIDKATSVPTSKVKIVPIVDNKNSVAAESSPLSRESPHQQLSLLAFASLIFAVNAGMRFAHSARWFI